MKKIFTYVFICLFSLAFGQAPSGYYNGTEGLTKAALKTKLSAIISNGHRDRGYDALYTAYATSDIDKYYENDGTLLDMYSENPTGTDPYNYRLGTKQCGNYSNEGDCYNREHTIPQSIFYEDSPMVGDGHHIVPSDGKVNGMRSNNPMANVSNPSFISKNGSKLGTSVVQGFYGTAFEPINEFKGDFARMFFYFVTRYENKLSTFKDFTMFNKTTYPSLSSWAIPLLLKWHKEDPVSLREIDRNNALYQFQGNRNPFIDIPEFVEAVWGDTTSVDPGNPDDTEKPTIPENLISQNLKATSVDLIWNISSDNFGIKAYNIYSNGVLIKTVSVQDENISNIEDTFGALIAGLQPETTYEFQVTAIDTSNNESDKSNTITVTTLKAKPGTVGTCGIEDFEKTEYVKDGYKDISWTNNNITWSASNARTDRNINNKAVTFRRLGTVKSSTISGGISNLTLSFINSFTNNNSVLKIKVISATETKEFTFPVTQTLDTKTVSVNIDKPFTFEFSINEGTASTSDDRRITIDDVSWDCYTLATNEIDIKNNNVIAYPNPIKNQEFSLQGLKGNQTINVYNSTGQLVQTFSNVQNRQKLMLRKLPKGIYILKSNQFSTKVIVE